MRVFFISTRRVSRPFVTRTTFAAYGHFRMRSNILSEVLKGRDENVAREQRVTSQRCVERKGFEPIRHKRYSDGSPLQARDLPIAQSLQEQSWRLVLQFASMLAERFDGIFP